MHALRSYIRDCDSTLEAFAGRVGVSRMTLYRAMRGQASLDLIRRIVAETEGAVTANDFLVREAAE